MTILIPRGVLELILHASKSVYPNEFGAVIRGEGNRIKELLLLPGTVHGRGFTTFHLTMLPIGSDGIGTVHSHPSGNKHPSDADLLMFSKTGNVNLIAGYPYLGLEDVAGYDATGKRVEVNVVESF